jgi:hypothetical protein
MDSFIEWTFSFGNQYGVNSLIFALLYFGTIPLSIFFFTLLVRNHQKQKPLFLPILGMFLCFIGTYIYLFLVGKNIPNWVWGTIGIMMIYGGYLMVAKIQNLRKKPLKKLP